MESCYLDYAMSVIVSRALPDVRDGMKPVHRRILYAMHDMGLRFSASFRKSAAVVGEVLGKYHPHGDSAVYDSMVRMAQEFSMRYELIRGQGNFGSIDGDNAAAMRYTEAKLEKISDEMLADIDKETVPWAPNYDGKFKEPKVLPARIPQLLLNGTTGIAVGMATSIPPHNLGEVVDGLMYLSENKETTIDDLLKIIKGPDFPTGGILYNREDIREAYTTGRGGMVTRAKAEIEERKNGKFAIIVTEIPYQVNKSTLISKMADLVRDKKVNGISDIRDESNREGIRVVIELKKDSYPKKILNQLFKYTQLQTSFNMNMIALVDGIQPRLLDLKQVLEKFIEHRITVITNRTNHELKVAKERAHILEGLTKALKNIDAVIETIKKSKDKDDAQASLIKKFKLTEIQAGAILEMRLQTLAGLERKKIEDEYKEKLALITKLEEILKSPAKIKKIMTHEFAEIKEKYNDPRRTKIIATGLGKFSSLDTIPNEPMVMMITKENYVKRVSPISFKTQKRGGKGVIGLTTKEEDEIKISRYAMTHDNALFFTNQGRVFKLPVYEIPQASRTAKGQAIVNLLQLRNEETITAMLIESKDQETKRDHLFMATKKGTVKKTSIEDFDNVRKSGLIAIKLRDGDSLEWVRDASESDEVVIITRNGQSVRFQGKDVRPMGRPSIGVRGIRLKDKDEVVEMDVVANPEEARLLVVMRNGLGKCTRIDKYRMQSRGGSGTKTANITEKTGKVVGARILRDSDEGDLMLISKKGQLIRLPIQNIPTQGRSTQGVYLMRLNKGDIVGSISILYLFEAKEEKPKEEEPKMKAKTKVKA
ncbi:DNA gyrase subunit A [Patescibacteria group bacterium]|nr:DNA gyrase subunit A [Patescibacteria group bacterium]